MADNSMKKVKTLRCTGTYINFRSPAPLVVAFSGWRSTGNFDSGINVNESINRKKKPSKYDSAHSDF